MKLRFAVAIAFFCISFSLQAQNTTDSFTIGIKFPAKTIVKGIQLNGDDHLMLPMRVTDSNRKFTGTVSSYEIFNLMVEYYHADKKKNEWMNIPLFIVPGYTEIIFAEDNPTILINGVSAQPRYEYALLVQDDQEYITRVSELSQKLMKYEKEKNLTQIKEYRKKLEVAETDRSEKLYAAFVHHNPNSVVSLYAMYMYFSSNPDNAANAEVLLNTMSPEQQNTPKMEKLRRQIQRGKTTMVGAQAPEFTQTDTLGQPLALTSLQGKYVLLDFWASWCKPCRAQNPALVKLFQKFKGKGFTVLSISLDSKKENWMTAIHQDKLRWYHVSDLKLWSNEVAKMYGINSVPQNFLLDPTGKIIAKNLAEDELEELLTTAYKKS